MRGDWVGSGQADPSVLHTHTEMIKSLGTVPAARWRNQWQYRPVGRSRSPWPSAPSAGSPTRSRGLLAQLLTHKHTHICWTDGRQSALWSKSLTLTPSDVQPGWESATDGSVRTHLWPNCSLNRYQKLCRTAKSPNQLRHLRDHGYFKKNIPLLLVFGWIWIRDKKADKLTNCL